MAELYLNQPHRRYNALTGDWVLVSPQRLQRPWQGKHEVRSVGNSPEYVAECYLCPGNKRANGQKNPIYKHTYVFVNDYAALSPDTRQSNSTLNPLIQFENVQGICRVICFSPKHNHSLAEMSTDEIELVIKIWTEQVMELGANYAWVQIFENKGEIMGCSNPHPHGQIWAGSMLPNEATKEAIQQIEYYENNNSSLLIDYLGYELKVYERVVLENAHWVVLIPFWAVWPFETLLLPKRPLQQLYQLTIEEQKSLATILKSLLIKYDNLFEISFPYTMGWHGAPHGEKLYPSWQLHAHFYPPLLRSSTIKKFMVGYELLAEAQRDIPAETAARKLRELSEIRFT